MDRGPLPLLPTGGQTRMEGTSGDSVAWQLDRNRKLTALFSWTAAEFHPP